MSSETERVQGQPPHCPICGNGFPGDEVALVTLDECPTCDRPMSVRVFPAYAREKVAVPLGERVTFDDESTCYFHATKRAQGVCGSCGRYVCGLCETELEGRTICPECIEVAHEEQSITSLVNRRMCYDSIALLLAIAPILVWPVTVLTGPASIVYSMWYWNAEGSLVRRGKVRFIIAILIGLLITIGWVFLIYTVLRDD
jgi:hypothetical protein